MGPNGFAHRVSRCAGNKRIPVAIMTAHPTADRLALDMVTDQGLDITLVADVDVLSLDIEPAEMPPDIDPARGESLGLEDILEGLVFAESELGAALAALDRPTTGATIIALNLDGTFAHTGATMAHHHDLGPARFDGALALT